MILKLKKLIYRYRYDIILYDMVNNARAWAGTKKRAGQALNRHLFRIHLQ